MCPEGVIVHHGVHIRLSTGTGIPVQFLQKADNFTIISGFNVPDFRKLCIHFTDSGNQLMHMQGMDETDHQRCEAKNHTQRGRIEYSLYRQVEQGERKGQNGRKNEEKQDRTGFAPQITSKQLNHSCSTR